jgi:catechol 2,3-dioxygenase-like lactoylglutathione lyase family enzyme
MEPVFTFKRTNTILYCYNWPETVAFYQHKLALPVAFASDWFVEFYLGGTAYLSLADERRATIKSGRGDGITLSLQVNNADEAWAYLQQRGLTLTAAKNHAWGGRYFFLFDPEGHRLEIWSPI